MSGAQQSSSIASHPPRSLDFARYDRWNEVSRRTPLCSLNALCASVVNAKFKEGVALCDETEERPDRNVRPTKATQHTKKSPASRRGFERDEEESYFLLPASIR